MGGRFSRHSTGKLTGAGYHAYNDTVNLLTRKGIEGSIQGKYLLESFFNNIEEIYAAADLVVSRAGAGTVFELALLEKPALLIPKRDLPGNHQWYNADVLEKQGAALLIEEKLSFDPNGNPFYSVDEKELYKILLDTVRDADKLNKMKFAGKEIIVPDAAERIIHEISGLLENEDL